MDLRTSRLTIWHTAWLLGAGSRADTESSIAKAVYRVANHCAQQLDGRSEVHR